MIGNATITTTAALALTAVIANRDTVLFLQNKSDTDIAIALGAANGGSLTTANGLTIKTGGTIVPIGNISPGNLAIYAIHGGAGNKSLTFQTA